MLICDLAETYGILDYRRVPARTLGTLTAGLGVNSRIIMKRNGVKAPFEVILLAQTFDLLTRFVWQIGGGNGEEPKSQLEQFMVAAKKESRVKGFNSGSEFEEARRKLLEEIRNGN